MRRRNITVTMVAFFLFVTAAPGTRAQVGQIGAPEGIRQQIEEKARSFNLGSAIGDIREYQSITGVRGWWEVFERGTLFYVPRHGVLLLRGGMHLEYRGHNWERTGTNNALGLPISNELRCLTPDPRDRYQLFERGAIFWRAAENHYFTEQGFTPATPGDCHRRPGPTGTVVTGPEERPGAPPPVRHRYRVSIIGFSVNRQTNDGLQEVDGKGDEIYITAQVAKFLPGQLTSHTMTTGVLMGDTNLRPANEERMTIGNLSPDGGIGDGYTYIPRRNPAGRYRTPTLPWVVYEGELTTGFDALMVIPVIWEWDGDAVALRAFQSVYLALRRPEFFYGRPPIRTEWFSQLVSESVRSSNGIAPPSWGRGPVITVPGAQFWPIPGGDQPIGLDLPTDSNREVVGPRRVFVPKVVFLTDQLAQRVVLTNYPLPALRTSDGNTGTTVEPYGTLGAGVVPIRYKGTDEGSGDYILYVQVEQVR